MLIKSVIAILVAVAIINALIVYACCVVAGRADEAEERWMNEKGSNEHWVD